MDLIDTQDEQYLSKDTFHPLPGMLQTNSKHREPEEISLVLLLLQYLRLLCVGGTGSTGKR